MTVSFRVARTATTFGLSFVIAAGLVASVARAGGLRTTAPADDRAFVGGLLAGDPAICASMTPALVANVEVLGHAASCERAVANLRIRDETETEAQAHDLLNAAHRAADQAASDNFYRLDNRAAWVGKRFTARQLAAEMRGSDTDRGPLRVKLGRAPSAARGTSGSTVVLDVARTTPRTLVLYAESPSGSIWALRGQILRKPTLKRTSARGVADVVATVPPTVFTLEAVGTDGSAIVLARSPRIKGLLRDIEVEFSPSGDADLLLTRTPAGLFDLMLFGTALLPPRDGVAPTQEPAALASTFLDALRAGDGATLCRLLDADFAALIGLGPADCATDDDPPTVDPIESPLPPPTANGTFLVGMTFGGDGGIPALDEYFVTVPETAGYRFTGAFIDYVGLLRQLIL